MSTLPASRETSPSTLSSDSDPPAMLSPHGRLDWTRAWEMWALLAGFALALATLWNNGFSIAMADGIAYIVGGLNLAQNGRFINPYGEYETWFPPLYPLLIGALSLGGRLNPVDVARAISAAFSLWGLTLVWRATLWGSGAGRRAAWLASACLAGNALYQTYAMAVMSHAAATACTLAAFVVWLKWEQNPPPARSLLALGAWVGLGFLVRPEVSLVLPLWLLIDAWGKPPRETARRALLSGAACGLFVLPYVVYLHEVTGRWSLSGKGEVTVAIGRGQFYGGPRERIDPDALELRYTTFETTPASELRRYAFNVSRMGQVFWRTLRGPVGLGLLLIGLCGLGKLTRERRWRFIFGLLAQLAFLAAVAVTWCEDRMLHAVWPVLAILVGVGADRLWQTARGGNRAKAKRLGATLLLIWAGLGWLEGATRQPRWSLSEGAGPKTLLRDAGLAFQQQRKQHLAQQQNIQQLVAAPMGAMYELGATVGYYAGQLRRPLPSANDLDTIVRYAQRRDLPLRAAWLVLWTGEAEGYHPTIREPFLADRLPLRKVFERVVGESRVAIYEIPPPFDPVGEIP